MSAIARPSTPVAQSAALKAPSTPQTGTWRHPKLDEIVRRQNASNFSDRNMRQIIYNAGGLVVLWFIGSSLWEYFPSVFLPGKALQLFATYGYHGAQILFTYNVLVALLPLFRTKDSVSDIPLTPAQRKLLGLPPSSAPPTPGSSYITPPRYARTPTPISGSPGGRNNYSESPLSRKGSPSSGSLSGSPFSPIPSPLLQKAIGGGMNGNRRHSYGSPSPLGPSSSRANMQEMPGTPSPAAPKGVNIGLNNKWLYEKGRRNSGNAKLYT